MEKRLPDYELDDETTVATILTEMLNSKRQQEGQCSMKEQEIGKSLSTSIPIPLVEYPIPSPAMITGSVNVVVCKNSLCWSELKSTEMVQWGRRRPRKSRKRKLPYGASLWTRMPKKLKHENQQITLDKPSKRKEVKNSNDRLSAQRYNSAKKNMLKIMKEKGAVFGNPIPRKELRAEAKKLIGDTCLLDHLLKHMVGEVVPGGEEIFMRRYNDNGLLEYWLESAMRKEAGVQDPYWTPPPGWMHGDNPTQDPVCAIQLNELMEEITKLKNYMVQIAFISQSLNRSMLETMKTVEDLTSVTSQNLVHDTPMLLLLEEKYGDLMTMKAKFERQVSEIAQSFCRMKKEMEKLKSAVQDPLLIMGSTTPP
ncbi:hypothetical protein REPUB_Repub07fG0008100 [Reevesia pubescens]